VRHGEAVFESSHRRGSREIGAPESSAAAGAFGGLEVRRAAGRGAGQARAAKR